MAAITKIEAWRDIGFIEGGVEAPRLGAPAPTDPDFVLQPESPIVPSRERFFSEIKLKEYYSGMLDIGYLRVTYSMNNSIGTTDEMIFYGWVENVTLLSDGDIPTVSISWHIDEWRTYAASAFYGSGHVKRRPFVEVADTPIQNYPVMSYHVGSWKKQLISYAAQNIAFILFSYNVNDEGVTDIRYGYVPVNLVATTTRCWIKSFMVEDRKWKCPSLWEIYSGKIDEYLEIDPEAIIGVWLTPMTPSINPLSGSGTEGDPFDFGPDVVSIGDGADAFGFIRMTNLIPSQRIIDLSASGEDFVPSEETRYIMTDLEGIQSLELPYGKRIVLIVVRLFVEPDEAYYEVSFKGPSDSGTRYDDNVGLTVVIPLPKIPINSNAKSSYVYSGQRQYDKDSRSLQTQANAWKNTSAQASQGAMMGTFGPQGLVLGLVGGLVGGLSSYATEQLWQNDEEQRISDRLVNKQTPSLILSGGAQRAIYYNIGLGLITLIPDAYSLSQLQSMRQQLGVSVDELRGNCESLVRNTGYFNIQNLTVTGDIPVSAKQTIKRKFASGVRLR